MANVFDYIAWRGDLSFKQSAFNDADNIILARLSFLPFDNIVPSLLHPQKEKITLAEAGVELLAANHEGLEFNLKDDLRLLKDTVQSRRFRNMRLFAYINHIDEQDEKQFAAMCIEVGDGTTYVSFRGTDKSLVGWKEDFNMSFMSEVPGQKQAINYLEYVAEFCSEKIRVGGHSKGGNLAVYSSAFCDPAVQERLVRIYNNDGPGFHEEVLDDPGFSAILGRVNTFVPQTSIVGMLLEHEEKYTIVKSSETGFFQHDLYSWQVMGKELVCLDKVTQSSRFIDQTLKAWLRSMDTEKRGEFVDALFSVIASTGVKTFDQLADNWYDNALRIGKTLYRMDPKMRRMIRKTLWSILQHGRNNLSIFNPLFAGGKKEQGKLDT